MKKEPQEKLPLVLRASLKALIKMGDTFIKQKKYYDLFIKEFKKLSDKVEKHPHLNFISLLESYKAISNILDNKISYFYNNRNKPWFKLFFSDKDLYELVKKDIELYHKRYPNIRLTLTKDGVMVYDNYQPNQFNALLLTVHSGTWVPKYIKELMVIPKERREMEEDLGTDQIYSSLVLEKGGIWVNNKRSRFACDFNRSPKKAVYSNKSEDRVKDIWKNELNQNKKDIIIKSYKRFYHLLDSLIETHRFNIVFDGHSMVNEKGRPDLSFGVKFVPQFYGPIVAEMRKTLMRETKRQVEINTPFSGGYILEFLSGQFPDIFVFSMEVNKKLYMDHTNIKIKKKEMKEISKSILKIFDF
ncbi:N-formylglutamate amidohydrolase [Nanoarchaeota archaeon]